MLNPAALSRHDRLGDYVECYNARGKTHVILLCDHAGCEVPPELDDLGIDHAALTDHIGWDIGAADVTRELSQLLDAPALLNHCSRLVIDPNRRPFMATSIPAVSDGRVIPANEHLTREESIRRVRRYFLPYHRRVARTIGAYRARGIVPVIIAVHSFTPRMNGADRPWHIGVLWRGDTRLSAPLIEALRTRGDLVIGDNQPYSGLRDYGFTIQFHAQRPRLPHIMVEIRNNEIARATDAIRYARILAEALRGPLADPDLFAIFDGDNLDTDGGLISWRHATRLSPLE